MCIVRNGALITGDSKGIIRGFLQDTEKSRIKSARKEITASARTHGTMKIAHPKDPTSPMLKQVGADWISIQTRTLYRVTIGFRYSHLCKLTAHNLLI